jgi:hypothetical protein
MTLFKSIPASARILVVHIATKLAAARCAFVKLNIAGCHPHGPKLVAPDSGKRLMRLGVAQLAKQGVARFTCGHRWLPPCNS